jgi:endonuclease/exonuclease/phosphatase family metal-dependent hydrolase
MVKRESKQGIYMLALAAIAAFGAFNEAAAQGKPDDVAVMTFNIRYDNPNDPLAWVERRDHVVDAIRYYDIVGVQEALSSQFEFLKTETPRFSSYGVGREADGSGEFCPIFWNAKRFDLLHSETVWLSASGEPGVAGWDADLPRIATDVLLYDRQTSKTFRVINTHFSHVGSEARIMSASLIRLRVNRGSADVKIVLGDLNAEPDDQAVLELISMDSAGTGDGLVDAHDAAKTRCRQSFGTFTGFDTGGLSSAPRIDHILTAGAKVTWFCVDERIIGSFYISDHLPVYVMLRP